MQCWDSGALQGALRLRNVALFNSSEGILQLRRLETRSAPQEAFQRRSVTSLPPDKNERPCHTESFWSLQLTPLLTPLLVRPWDQGHGLKILRSQELQARLLHLLEKNTTDATGDWRSDWGQRSWRRKCLPGHAGVSSKNLG